MKIFHKIFLLMCLCWLTPAFATLNVLTCEPEWAALVKELGGAQVKVTSATTALQDPHQIQARPSLIAQARKADLIVCTGAELEIGWLPLLLERGNNSKILEEQPGNFIASKYVRMLGVPTRVDRADGDVHPQGNPHIHLDPRNILLVAKPLCERLSAIDPSHAKDFAQNFEDFQKRWQAALVKWQNQAAPLKDMQIVVHHDSWAYLNHWLSLNQVGTLETKPGIPPSATHLSELLRGLHQRPAKVIIRAAYEEADSSEWLSKKTGIPAVMLPFTVGGDDKAQDLFGLFDDTLQRLNEAITLSSESSHVG